MILTITGSPYMVGETTQKVVVSYNEKKDATFIDCDLDIVTLGLAVNLLGEVYKEYLAKLSPDLAETIRTTTRKAVLIYGKHTD